MSEKTAEPPPPKGVSLEEWDRILQKGPKMKAETEKTAEQLAFEELTATPTMSTEHIILNEKISSADDTSLLKVAASLCTVFHADGSQSRDLDEVLQTYEELGGTYKHAFGTPMFDAKQMAGSPAVAGGMAARARTPMPGAQSQPVSVTTTTIGQNQQGGASAPSAPSTPSAPTG